MTINQFTGSNSSPKNVYVTLEHEGFPLFELYVQQSALRWQDITPKNINTTTFISDRRIANIQTPDYENAEARFASIVTVFSAENYATIKAMSTDTLNDTKVTILVNPSVKGWKPITFIGILEVGEQSMNPTLEITVKDMSVQNVGGLIDAR